MIEVSPLYIFLVFLLLYSKVYEGEAILSDGPSCVIRSFHSALFQQQKSQVFCWDGRRSSRWHKLDNIRVELPTQTLLEVEFVVELRGEVRVVHKECCASLNVCFGFLTSFPDDREISPFSKEIMRPQRINSFWLGQDSLLCHFL